VGERTLPSKGLFSPPYVNFFSNLYYRICITYLKIFNLLYSCRFLCQQFYYRYNKFILLLCLFVCLLVRQLQHSYQLLVTKFRYRYPSACKNFYSLSVIPWNRIRYFLCSNLGCSTGYAHLGYHGFTKSFQILISFRT
jgi:hypothetical protein